MQSHRLHTGKYQVLGNFNSKALHPGDKDVGSKKLPHNLAAVHSKLPAVEIFINVMRIPVIKRHLSQLLRNNTFSAGMESHTILILIEQDESLYSSLDYHNLMSKKWDIETVKDCSPKAAVAGYSNGGNKSIPMSTVGWRLQYQKKGCDTDPQMARFQLSSLSLSMVYFFNIVVAIWIFFFTKFHTFEYVP